MIIMNVTMGVLLTEEKKLCIFSIDPSIIIKIKSRETEQLHNEMKGEGLINCDTINKQQQTKQLGIYNRIRAFQ